MDSGSTFKAKAPDIPLPLTGFVRLPTVLRHIPVCPASWWAGVKEGRYPKPVKLGPRTTAWRVEDIRALIARLGQGVGDAA